MKNNIAHRAVTRTFVVFAPGLLFVAAAGTARGGSTERVSVASDGTQGNIDSYNPSISADGRYVAFHSGADWRADLNRDGAINIQDLIFVRNSLRTGCSQ